MSALRSRKESSARASKPELKVVSRRKKKGLINRAGTRLAPLTILAVIAIGGIVAGILLEQVVLAQSAFKLTKIRQELTIAEENREVLMLEAAKLDSAARIEKYARENLGMVDPEPHNVRYIVADIRSGTKAGSALAAGQPFKTPARAAADAAALGMADAP
jgi:cell division protein FtsL